MNLFLLQAYDVNGIWDKNAGANAPLYYSPKVTGVEPTSGNDAVKAWIAAGIPAEQLVLGVPFYGRVSKTLEPITASTGLYVPISQSSQIKGDSTDEKAADPCPNAVATYSGQYIWRTIAQEGIARNSSGWVTYWDDISKTPYAYSFSGSKVLSFDDAASLQDKVDYAKKQGLGGVMLWSLEMVCLDLMVAL